MKNLILKLSVAVSMMATLFFVLMTFGCAPDLSSDVDSLKKDVDELKVRVETLEDLVDELEKSIDAGSLISSVDPLVAPKDGWLITFSDGKSIEINHGKSGADGEDGSTPKIEVKTNSDGSVTLWVNDRNTGIDLKGADGDPGDPAVAPRIEVRTNLDGTISVWYNVGDGWVDTGVDITAPSKDDPHPIKAIVENGDGSYTITLNDGNDTQYTFGRYSTAMHLQVMNTTPVEIAGAQGGKVTFRVNPSDAWIATGDTATGRWLIDEYSTTRASYVNPSQVFSIKSILPDADKAGQYVATISGDFASHDVTVSEYVMALVFNNSENTSGEQSQISSSPFRLTIVEGEPVLEPGLHWARSNIVWDGTKLTFAVTQADNETIPANVQGVQFLWGSLVAMSPAALTGTDREWASGQYPAGHIVYDPTGTYDYVYKDVNTTVPFINNNSGAPFNNADKTEDDFATFNGNTGFDEAAGTGDICRFIASKGWIDGTGWRMPTVAEFEELKALSAPVVYGGTPVWTPGNPMIPGDGTWKTTWTYLTNQTTPAGNSDKGDNAFGFYQFDNAWIIGKDAAAEDDLANPANGVVLPASGYRDYFTPRATAMGSKGYNWTSSSYSGTKASNIYGDGSGIAAGNNSPMNANSIRCVRYVE